MSIDTDPGFNPSTYTCQDIATDVMAKFGDTGGVQITPALILAWINNGARRISAAAPFVKRVGRTPILAGISSYDMKSLFAAAAPTSIDSIIAYGHPVKILSWQEFNEAITAPQLGAVAANQIQYAAEYGGDLVVWPVPNATLADALVVYYTALPARVANLTDALPVPDRLYNALNDYVLQQALELDENFEASEIKRQHAEAGIREQINMTNGPTDLYPQITEDPADYAW